MDKPHHQMIAEALVFAANYGSIDGAHHKMWVIDQMVRCLLGEYMYSGWARDYKNVSGEDWDVGIAP